MNPSLIALIIFSGLTIVLFLKIKKKFNFFETIIIIDLVLKVINFIMSLFELKGIFATVDMYLPDSLEKLINSMTAGTFNEILIIAYYVCLIIFLYKLLKKVF